MRRDDMYATAPVYRYVDGAWRPDTRWPNIGAMPRCWRGKPMDCPRCNAMLHADMARTAMLRKAVKR